MATDVRERMVRSAIILLAKHGVQGTSFRDVVEHSQTPRGSIYHHFPEGKDQLLAEAVEVAGSNAVGVLDALEGLPPAEIVDGFMAMWRAVLERSDFAAGCSVLAVTVSSETPELIDRAGVIFRAWTDRLADLFAASGMSRADAANSSTLLIAASEGAVVLARAQRDLAPLETVRTAMRRAVAG